MAKKKSSAKASTKPRSVLPNASEIRGLLLLMGVLLLILSLQSFAFGHAGKNWLGLIGYTLGGLIYYGLGLSSYVLAAFLAWVGWRLLTSQPVEQKGFKVLACTLLGISLGVLLNVLETYYPKAGTFFNSGFKGEFHLGGAPLYYLYKDMPSYNLQRILNTPGIIVVFTSTLVASFLALTHLSLLPFLNWLANQWQKKAEQQDEPTDSSLWRLVGLKLGGAPQPTANKESATAEMLAIKPETDLRERPSLSSKGKAAVLAGIGLRQAIKKATARPTEEPPAPPAPSKREQALTAQRVYNGDFAGYKLPPLSLLTEAQRVDQTSLKKDLRRQAEVLEETLQSFGIDARVGQINCGPTITSFEVHPAIGVKVQKIKALENDIALNMEARSIRIIAPIPGKAAVGIEVPNPKPQEVGFKDMLQTYQQGQQKFRIPVLLGKAVNGDPVMADLAKMPHCIIAGATGSGKSVCINTIVMSIVFNASPDQVKLIMVDPKKVELTPYTALPHMLAPVITEPQGACAALHWLTKEMEGRYELLKLCGVRNIEAFNSRKPNKAVEEALNRDVPEKMHYIVAIIDELADLMMVSTYDIETPIARIAQMARAVGIHLILATQRPSREVITGLIKANFPTRISFKVASRVNSQIVLDEIGAESLLGNGDMLFLPPASSHLTRAQGAYVRDEDIQRVIKFVCDQAPPRYAIASFDAAGAAMMEADQQPQQAKKGDSLFEQAKQVVASTGNASTTFLQRKLKIGYARAASLMDQLEEEGVISASEDGKTRKVVKKGEERKGREEGEREEEEEEDGVRSQESGVRS